LLVLALPAAEPAEYADVRAAGIRAIAQSGAVHLYPQIYRAAHAREDLVREAVVEALLAIAKKPTPEIRALLEDADELAREVAVRYLSKRSAPAELESLMMRALADRSARVQLQGIAMVSARRSVPAIPALVKIARVTPDDRRVEGEHQRLAAAEALGALAELVAARDAAETTWRPAAEALAGLGEEAFAVLVDAISRAPDARRNQLIQSYTLGEAFASNDAKARRSAL
jgi:hypothetical protein